jgi:hypothetical protein
MKLNIIGKLLPAISILLAVWYFDWHDWNRIFTSVLLFLSGIIGFLTDTQSKSLTKLKELLQIIAVTIVFIFLIKLIFVG